MEAQIIDILSENDSVDIAVQICAESPNEDYKWFDQREQHVRNEDFFEITIPLYSLDDFQKHFKISRSSMQVRFYVHHLCLLVYNGHIILVTCKPYCTKIATKK